MIICGQEKICKLKLPDRLRFRPGDAEYLPFIGGSFRITLLGHYEYWLRDHVGIVLEALTNLIIEWPACRLGEKGSILQLKFAVFLGRFSFI